MPTKDPDTKGRTGNLTETHDYIVSVTTTSRLASEEYAYAPNQVAADGLQVLEANRRRFYRAHLPSFPRKRESPGLSSWPRRPGCWIPAYAGMTVGAGENPRRIGSRHPAADG